MSSKQSVMYKKFLLGSASAALVAAAVAPAASAAQFTDSKGNTHEAAIDALSDAGVITGYPDGTFLPNKTLTRSDVVKLMGKWLVTQGYKVPTDYNTTMRFDDLTSKSNDELLQYAAIVKDNGVFNGSNGSLLAGDNITRENMAIVLVRAFDKVKDIDLEAFVKEQDFKKDVIDLATAKAEARPAIDVLDFFDITNPIAPAFNPKNTTTRGQFATFLHKTINTDFSVVKKDVPLIPLEPSIPVKTEVKAINATTVEVNFKTAVAESDAAGSSNLTKYKVGAANPTTVELSEDGKKATLTFAASIEGENLAVVVEPITTKADDNVKTERYATVLTYTDTVMPTVSKVESITGGDHSTSATLTFSEPIKSVGTIKIDGVALASSTNYTLTPGATELELTGLNLDATKEHTLEIVNLEDTAKPVSPAVKGNVTALTTQKFNIVVDKVAPTVTSVDAKSDTALVFTFSKKVDLDTKQAATALKIVDADLTDQTTTLLSTNQFTEVAGSNGTKFEVALAATPFAGTAKTADLTVQIKDKVIADAQGNKVATDTKKVTVKKDEAAPVLTNANYRKDVTGKVKELVFTFDEDITLTTTTTLTDLLADKSVNVENSVAGTLADAFGGTVPAGTFTVKDNVITFALTAPTAYSGNFNLEVAATKVKDKSLTKNDNKATAFALDFGAASAEGTFKVATASATATNVITVDFGTTAVKGGTGAGSATALSAYKLNGEALPEGTTITLNATQTKALITLPAGTIKDTDVAAIFVASAIESKDGKKNLETFTGTVAINDNVAPELTGVSLTTDNNLLVSFSEAVVPNIADLEIKINGTVVNAPANATLTITPGTGSDVGKYIINLKDLVKFETPNTVVNLTTPGSDIVIANADVTSTFKYATSSAITSIDVKVVGDATVDKANPTNKIKTGTEIKVK